MKKITTLLLVLFISIGSYAQFNLYWNQVFNYTSTSGFSNEVRKVATDASGNIFMLSDITSDIDSAGHVGPTQFYVVLQKYTPAGALLVQKQFNVYNMQVSSSFNYSSAFALIVDPSGSVYIGFNRYNVVGSNYDVQVMKFNNTLTTAWTFRFATIANETGVNLVLRNTAPFLLFKSEIGVNTTFSVVRCEPNFINTVPRYSFDTNIDVVNSITTTSTSNLYFTGYRMISGVKNVMTASVNTSGTLKWKQTFNNNTVAGDDVGTKLMIGTDGFLYVAGTSFVNGTNGNDALVLRYNAYNGNRNFQLAINYNLTGPNSDVGFDIAQGTGGFIYLGATKGNSDVLIHKISTINGLAVNATASYKPTPGSYTSLNGLTIGEMKIVPNNNLYVSGTINGASAAGNFSASYLVKFGMVSSVFSSMANTTVEGSSTNCRSGIALAVDISRNNLISVRNNWRTNATHAIELILLEVYNMGALRISGVESVSEASNNLKQIFYPNPATQELFFHEVEFVEPLRIYDISGKMVLGIDSPSERIDIASLTPGIYFFKSVTKDGSKSEKIIVY